MAYAVEIYLLRCIIVSHITFTVTYFNIFEIISNFNVCIELNNSIQKEMRVKVDSLELCHTKPNVRSNA